MKQHEKKDTPVEMLDLASLFRHASRLMARRHHSRGRKRHTSHAQGRVLHILHRTGPVSQSALLEMMDLRSSSLSELLAKLERAGLVRRERNEADRRGFVVSATEAAGDLLAKHEEIGAENAESLFSCLDDAERNALRNILEKLVASIRELPEPGSECGLGSRCHHGRGKGRRGGCGQDSEGSAKGETKRAKKRR